MDLMIEKLLAPVLVLTRISAFFLILPVFGWTTIPVRIKVAMTVLISLFFSMLVPFNLDSADISVGRAILLMFNESLYGLALGAIATMLFSAVKIGGRIIERQIGFAMAEVLDPLTGERTQPLGSMLEIIFVLLFLSANGHHLFLSIISKSYDAFPIGSIPTVETLTSGMVLAGSAMLIAGLKLAAPILAAFLLLMVILAIFARVVPEMNILFISLPMRVGLGLIMLSIFIPFIGTFVSEFADLMSKLLPL